MLDENLPTFFIKPAAAENPLSSTIYLSENGSEPHPGYSLRKPDPNLSQSKNCYAIALYDSYSPDVLYAEVLVRPEWTQPPLSTIEIRAQNGSPGSPVPIVPSSFTIQLYNPDQQVLVRQIAGTWNSSAYWEFEMPQKSFRVPSASALDRSQSDPAASEITPKMSFRWKRDGKLSRNISCYLSVRGTDGKKIKEPDITIAFFKGGKDLTLYQPNMQRVEVEDAKGLEVVLILGGIVIKDIFFNANREMFNISLPQITGPGGKWKNSGPAIILSSTKPLVPTPQIQAAPTIEVSTQPPLTDPLKQWEIDAETERLKKVVAAAERAREKAEREEERRIKKMLETEEKELRRRKAEVEKETERLRKQYGVPIRQDTLSPPPLPPRRVPQRSAVCQSHSAQNLSSVPDPREPSPSSLADSSLFHCPRLNGWLAGASLLQQQQQQQQQQKSTTGPYLQAQGPGSASASASASASGFFGLAKKVQKRKTVSMDADPESVF